MKLLHAIKELLPLLGICLVLSAVAPTDSFAKSEKGPRCSNGVDDDGDDLVDKDDPDCGGDDTSGGSGTEEVIRVFFWDRADDRFKSDLTDHYWPCFAEISDPNLLNKPQYWLTTAEFVDQSCQVDQAALPPQPSHPIARMAPGLTGSVGLWFESHSGSYNLGTELIGDDEEDTPPPENRWWKLDFGGCIHGPDGERSSCACPDIDEKYRVPNENPGYNIADYQELLVTYDHMIPDEAGEDCVDNIEGRFRAAINVWTKQPGELVEGPNIQIRFPRATTLKNKRRQFGYGPEYHLTFHSFVVTDPGDGSYVTMECNDDVVSDPPGHECKAELVRNRLVKRPNEQEPEVIGTYKIPVKFTLLRTICDSSGVCADANGSP